MKKFTREMFKGICDANCLDDFARISTNACILWAQYTREIFTRPLKKPLESSYDVIAREREREIDR